MIIARDNELKRLRDAKESVFSSLFAVFGRRRVGKTFLVREAYNYDFTFQHAGVYKGTYEQELEAFRISLGQYGAKYEQAPKDWMQAFEWLMNLIGKSRKKKKVVFLDELSWMHTQNSDFLQALEFFWNSWASARKDVILVLCASATSWLMRKIVHSKGGMYNRLTGQIKVSPFVLSECLEYAKSNNLGMSKEQVAEYYMIAGGIPFYWSLLEKGKSLPQNVDAIYFNDEAQLRHEYEYLFGSLFDAPDPYLNIIRMLGTKKVGMTREELTENEAIKNNGDLSEQLKDLEQCGFIRKYTNYGYKTKGAVWQLIDNFVLFHFKFLADRKNGNNYWQESYNSQQLRTWRGLAYERICLLHINQIKSALGISGVQTQEYAWYCKEDKEKGLEGSQIDLLIERGDNTINLCEIKFTNRPFTIEKSDEDDIQTKLSDFLTATKTKKSIHITLLSANGIKPNMHSAIIQKVVTLDDLFK